MGLEIIGMLITGIAGLVSLIHGTHTWMKRGSKSSITFESNGQRYVIDSSQVSKEHIDKLLLQVTEPTKEKETPTSKETGNVLAEALLLIIPGVIALMLAGTFIYLLIVNQATPNYSTPKELGSAMTTIIGYYFGLGASLAINKAEVLSPDQVKALING